MEDLFANEEILNPYKKLEHPCFLQPSDDSIRVWRYLDLSKFVWLLEYQKLYFSRLDLLNDQYEGSLPYLTAKNHHEYSTSYALMLSQERLVKEFGLELGMKKFKLSIPEIINQRQRSQLSNKQDRRRFYINCWHLNMSESEAMWRLYCPQNEGVAIQTTYKKLVESTINDSELYIGCVNYIDYETDNFPMDNLFYRVMHKRISFSHENEVRMIKMKLPDNWGTPQEFCTDGIELDWQLNSVVEAIHINPYASNFYYDVVKKLVSRISPQLSERVIWSKLRSLPNY